MCPPGVDQTGRMSQVWALMAPLLDQKHKLPIADWTVTDPRSDENSPDINDFIKRSRTFGAFAKLARPAVPDSQIELLELDDTGDQISTNCSPVEGIPLEILDMIISDSTLTKTDVVCFGLCSQALWRAVLFHIDTDLRRNCGLWRLTPIVCLGNWLQSMPPKMKELYPSLKTEQDVFLNRSIPGTGRGNWGVSPVRTWNYRARDAFKDIAGQNARQKWLIALKSCATVDGLTLFQYTRLVKGLCDAMSLKGQHTGTLWALRNHDTNQYIRLKLSDDSNGKLDAVVENASWLSLDTALLMRICWSGHYKNSKQDSGEARQGVWACHRFDIVPVRTFDDDLLSSWQDGTDEIVKEAIEDDAVNSPKTTVTTRKKSTRRKRTAS